MFVRGIGLVTKAVVGAGPGVARAFRPAAVGLGRGRFFQRAGVVASRVNSFPFPSNSLYGARAFSTDQDLMFQLTLLNQLAHESVEKGDHTEAAEILEKSVRVSELLNKDSFLIDNLTALAATYMNLDRFEDAKKLYLRVVALEDTAKETVSANFLREVCFDAYVQLGTVETKVKNFEEAKAYFEKAATYAEDTEDGVRLGTMFATLFLLSGDHYNAYEMSKVVLDSVPPDHEAYAVVKPINEFAFESIAGSGDDLDAKAWYKLAAMQHSNEDNENAAKSLENALKQCGPKDSDCECRCYVLLASLAHQSGDIAANDAHLNRALQIATDNGHKNLVNNIQKIQKAALEANKTDSPKDNATPSN